MKRLLALLWLSVYLVRHVLLRLRALVSRAHARRVGLASFSDNYRDDGIVVLTPEETADFGEFSRCIRCGLCDTFCANSRNLNQGYESVSLLASTHSRSLADAYLADELTGRFTACGDCVRCFDRCPTQVPIARLVARLERLGAEQLRARRGPAGPG